jgi:glycosyltransferase involved in cell wall biosynthesis
MTGPLVTILINNYNYERFLREAIDSALSQSYRPVEIIVVDDGSTDQSQEIILSYGSRLTPVFKENGGQASAFNAGIAASRGDIICLLDSDDYFNPGKIERIVELFNALNSAKPLMVHHKLKILHEDGKAAEQVFDSRIHESPLNLAEYARKHKFISYAAGPTSGISINRRMSDLLFPLPENIRISADDFVVLGASLVGEMHYCGDVLGTYRVHGKNYWYLGNRRKSAEFQVALDRYLNQKLKENKLPGRISFSESMYCWWDMAGDRRWAELAWRMVKTNAVQHDRVTWLHTCDVCMTVASHFFKKVLPPKFQKFVKNVRDKTFSSENRRAET